MRSLPAVPTCAPAIDGAEPLLVCRSNQEGWDRSTIEEDGQGENPRRSPEYFGDSSGKAPWSPGGSAKAPLEESPRTAPPAPGRRGRRTFPPPSAMVSAPCWWRPVPALDRQ